MSALPKLFWGSHPVGRPPEIIDDTGRTVAIAIPDYRLPAEVALNELKELIPRLVASYNACICLTNKGLEALARQDISEFLRIEIDREHKKEDL